MEMESPMIRALGSLWLILIPHGPAMSLSGVKGFGGGVVWQAVSVRRKSRTNDFSVVFFMAYSLNLSERSLNVYD